jgi:predicted methyltransferase
MRILLLPIVVALAVATAPVHATDKIPDYVAAAVADKDRPKEDTDRDVNRKPAEIMAMTGIKAGDTAVDVGPGKTGYYTKILSRIVGANGKVIMFNPTWVAEKYPQVKDGPTALNAAGYKNVEGSIQPMAEIKFDKPVDLVFVSQIYHDQVWQKIDIAKMNKAVFDALKPGGVYFIIDHSGPGVTTPEQIDKVHRIDQDEVKKQILAAGFKLEAESDILLNPADPKNILVFDPSIRGKTDQFVYKFRKPAK